MDSPIKGNVEVQVEGRSVDKLIDAVVDTFSPATEFLGYLGDSVRLARVEKAAEITLKAKEIANQNGLELTAPPLKFLVPFYEKASLEDSDDLTNMWANLLLSSSTEKENNRYINILAELTNEQANYLKDIFHGSSNIKVDFGLKMGKSLIENEINGIHNYPSISYWKRFQQKISDDGEDLNNYMKSIEDFFNRRGVIFRKYSFSSKELESVTRKPLREDALLTLDNIGLLKTIFVELLLERGAHIYFEYSVLSDFALAFMSACDPKIKNELKNLN